MNSKTTILFLSLFTVFTTFSSAQSSNTWIAFFDDEGEDYLIGFKDKDGNIMIPPFEGYTTALKFDDIIGVLSKSGKYYLLKDGTRFGKDSLHTFDLAPDCESEKFIKFRDPKTGKTGFFNHKGKVAIPAEYDDTSSVTNGVFVGLKGAYKHYWDPAPAHSGCNHWSWKGGVYYLVNTENQILVTNFTSDSDEMLNLYSLQIAETPSYETFTESFPGENGKYYQFINQKKHFEQWFIQEYSNNLTPEKMIQHSYSRVKLNNTILSQNELIQKYFTFAKNNLETALQKNQYFISSTNSLYLPEEQTAEELTQYYSNCGYLKPQYPLFSISISNKIKGKTVQGSWDFLTTDKGYKLVSATLRSYKN